MENEKQTDSSEFVRQAVSADVSLCLGPDGESFLYLSGGIVNHNLKVYLAPEATAAVLSVYLSNGREMVNRELFTRVLIGLDTHLPVQKVIHSGVKILADGKEYGFLIKEFKEGKTLNDIFTNPTLENLNMLGVRQILYDLGKDLHTLSSIKLSKFGKIEGGRIIGPSENCTWKDYYFYRLVKRIKTLSALDPDTKVGEYGVKDILELVPGLLNYSESQSDILDTIVIPHFVHNDFHFMNILASTNGGKWHVSGILDLENATAGDTEFDLISIESQLNLTPEYKDLFMANIEYFRAGYENTVSKEYIQKRGLYHLTWSLSYFEAVMQMDTNLHPVNTQINRYMEGHYKILKDLASGTGLEDEVPLLF